MKKFISIILSASLGISAACIPEVSTSFAADESNSLVVFGDSIAAGYGLSDTEYCYDEICADYLGWDYTNYGQDGYTTDDLYSLLTTDAGAAEAAANADVIVVSIGGNDIIIDVLEYLIDWAAEKDILADGKTSDDIPEDMTISAAKELLDQTKLKNYISSNMSEATSLASGLKQTLIGKSGGTGTIQDSVIPGVAMDIEKLSELNPDAEIIVQTVYQPIQFSSEYWEEKFGTGAEYANYKVVVNILRNTMIKTMDTFSSELDALIDTYDFKVADIYEEFTSGAAQSAADQGYAYLFTNIQTSGDDRDIHPNQKGHLAIAAAVLEQIGQLKDAPSTSLLRQVYAAVTSDGSLYPDVAYETYALVAGNETDDPQPASYTLGDVNSDNVVDAIDASLVLGAYAKASTVGDTGFTETQTLAADVNGDNVIDAVDASLILGYYAYTSTGGTDSPEDYFNK